MGKSVCTQRPLDPHLILSSLPANTRGKPLEIHGRSIMTLAGASWGSRSRTRGAWNAGGDAVNISLVQGIMA